MLGEGIVFAVTYNLESEEILLLTNSHYQMLEESRLDKLGSIEVRAKESGTGYDCISTLQGFTVTDTRITPLATSGSSVTTIVAHDSLLTPQGQTPTLGSEPNFRAVYSSTNNRWELRWDSFNYGFRNGKTINVASGSLYADDGFGKYYVFLDVPVITWDLQSTINLPSTALQMSKDLLDEFGTNVLYKLRMGAFEISSNVASDIPEVFFFESAVLQINASHINAGTITGDLIASSAIATRHLEARRCNS